MLWTEKYQPVRAADIIGNTKQVKRLSTWLTEWKHKTDMEMKRLKKQLLKEARRGKISKEEVKKSKLRVSKIKSSLLHYNCGNQTSPDYETSVDLWSDNIAML